MPTKIRLQRFGKKGKPFYHVVIADSRAPRDGKYIEKIGIYNPNTNPATIEVNSDKALSWLQTGAVPTDTVRALLKYTGVVYKNHLLKGVAKGAFSEAEAEKKYEAWKKDKDSKVQAKKDGLAADIVAKTKKIFAAETEIKETRAKAIAALRISEAEAAQVAENESAAEAKADLVEEAPQAETAPEVKAETAPEVKAEAAPEAKAEAAPEAKAEAAPEAKAEEAPKAKAEKAPEAKAEEAPKAKAEKAPEAKAEEAPKAKAEETPKAEEKKD